MWIWICKHSDANAQYPNMNLLCFCRKQKADAARCINCPFPRSMEPSTMQLSLMLVHAQYKMHSTQVTLAWIWKLHPAIGVNVIYLCVIIFHIFNSNRRTTWIFCFWYITSRSPAATRGTLNRWHRIILAWIIIAPTAAFFKCWRHFLGATLTAHALIFLEPPLVVLDRNVQSKWQGNTLGVNVSSNTALRHVCISML